MEKCYPPSTEVAAEKQPPISVPFDETSAAVANITSMLEENQSMSISPEPNNYAEKVWINIRKSLKTCHLSNSPSFKLQSVIHNTPASYQSVVPAPIDTLNSDDDLKKCAGEILNGIKRTVEVQIVHPPNHFYTQESSILGKQIANFILSDWLSWKSKTIKIFVKNIWKFHRILWRLFPRLSEPSAEGSNCAREWTAVNAIKSQPQQQQQQWRIWKWLFCNGTGSDWIGH